MHVLFDLLIKLDRKEMTRFKDFALSPYYNKHVGVRSVVVYLNSIYPQFTEKTCGNSALVASVFPDNEEGLAQIPVLLTYVRRLLYQFLDTEGYRQSALSDSIYLLSKLRNKKQKNFHAKYLNKERVAIMKQPYRDGRHFYKHFLLATEADQMYSEQADKSQKEALQQKADHLDAYYLSEKLKDSCEMLVRSRMVQTAYSSILMDAILQVIRKDKARYFQIPPINVYYHIYQMIVSEESEAYQRALDAVEKFANFLPREELQNIYNYLQNYCIYQINSGESSFLRSSFELYQIQLVKGLLFVREQLPEAHYKNMVTAGLRLKELEWVRQFLEDYRPLLVADVRENAYAYNLAEYHYATKNYKEAMQLLLQVAYTNPRYSMGAKALLLRTYYDLEEYEPLMALCKSFAQLLHRDKSISEFRRKGYKHLFKFTQKASQLRYRWAFTKVEKSKLALEKLRREMDATSPIFNQRWLEERLDRLGRSSP